MLNKRMVGLGTQRSVIRELFEFGKIRAAEVGAENVFDFSIGNPSVPSPDSVTSTALDLLKNSDPDDPYAEIILHTDNAACLDAVTGKPLHNEAFATE